MAEPKVYELRGRLIYRKDEQVALNPGDTGIVGMRQVRAMQDAIAKARVDGRLSASKASAELKVLREVRDALALNPLPRHIVLASKENEFRLSRKAEKAKGRKRRR